MEKNLLAEKIISLFRTRDTHTHRNVKFMTINEDAIRYLFDTNDYLQKLSLKEHNKLQQEMKEAEEVRLQAETETRERNQRMKEQAEKIRQNRIESKIVQQKQEEEARRKRKNDARKTTVEGADSQKTLRTFHMKTPQAGAAKSIADRKAAKEKSETKKP